MEPRAKPGDAAVMEPSFERVAKGGVVVADPIERHRYTLSTPTAVAPEPTDTDRFRVPVDAAVSVRTAAVSLSSVISVHVRNQDGLSLCTAEHFAYEELPSGEYTIELSAPIKLYLHVESAVTVCADADGMRIDFGDATEVAVGARSHHDRPATSVTTTTDPEAMMRAVSTFGSALKTTSPERSYPTLRGHPPTVNIGDELDLAGLEAPDTGVTIEVPPTHRSVFVVSPLAYYLGARVVPGEEPLIRTDEGFVYPLDGPSGFARTVERTLKQAFFLDCLTRTEGLYPVALHERRLLDGDLGLDFASLYERSLSAQLEAYLSVPFAALDGMIPEWKLTTHVEPTPTSVELLPFVVADLAVVRCGNPEAVTNPAKTMAFDSPTRTPSVEGTGHRNEFTRSTRADAPVETNGTEFVRLEPTESLEQAWVGDGIPLGASKATVEAYRNRLDRMPAGGDIDITVVCNDAAMDEERGLIDEIYGDRDLPFDVTVERDLTTAELERVLSTQTDFLHYIGHIDRDGFECVNGKLDAATLESVGVDAFLLNACQSYQQGMNLIESGSIGGIVTLSDVLNGEAVTMGRTLAGLLNAGFPLRAALDIARDESIIGGMYLVVGDGGLAIAQSASGNPNLLYIERDGLSFNLEVETYPTSQCGVGTLIAPNIIDNEYHISGGKIQSFELTKEEVEDFLLLEDAPIRNSGKLFWSYQADIDQL
jgi:hypothetical protein